MHVDLEHPSLPGEFRSEVCVIGAGTAGILVAARLARAGISVNLLEGGGLSLEERSQGLYDIQTPGCAHAGVREGRFRTFGGASTRWGGGLLPYPEDVLHPPSLLRLPNWPLALSEIEPYYEELQQIMGVDLTPFSDELLKTFRARSPFQSTAVRLRYCKTSPFNRRNLARTLGRECLAHPRVTVFTHCNVVSVDLEKNGGAIRTVSSVNYGGVRYRFHAQQFILSTGTIEACRLLLASRDVCGSGVGNERDQVGRYFHDNVGLHAAEVGPEDRQRMIRAFAPYMRGPTLYKARLEAAEQTRVERGWLSVGAEFPIEEPEGSDEDRVLVLLRALQRGEMHRIVHDELRHLPLTAVQIGRMLIAAKVKRRRYISNRARMMLHVDVEQRPDPESRVRLAPERDAVGMPRAVLDWKISAEERETLQCFALELKKIFQEQGLANLKLKWESSSDAGLIHRRDDSFHMMGGLRMGTDPSSSVVDRSLLVHGVRNLRVLSCAVFPTGGSSNPTFTMLALGLRLADQVAQTGGGCLTASGMERV
ncbi:MAG: GMC family oxidoreductase [Acidobacteriaceae bacterium]